MPAQASGMSYEANGSNAGMAAFIAMTSWQGEYTDDYFAQPTPDPAMFGMPTEDDGTRDDPLLSDRSWAISSYRPDVDALIAAPTRVVIAVGEESAGTFTARTSLATAELLKQDATVFPSHHGGFMGGEFGYAGQPEAFARKLREVLDSRTDFAPQEQRDFVRQGNQEAKSASTGKAFKVLSNPWPCLCRLVRHLGGPQVGTEDLVADAGGGHVPGEQGGADVPHERQRPAGEDLDVRRQRDAR